MLASQLVKHLQGALQSTGYVDESPPILRCEIKHGKKCGSTYAFVIVRSEALARLLLGLNSSMEGRNLRINRSSASYVRPMGTSPGFSCRSFQVCVEWPQEGLTCLWQVDSGVSFQVGLERHTGVYLNTLGNLSTDLDQRIKYNLGGVCVTGDGLRDEFHRRLGDTTSQVALFNTHRCPGQDR